MGRSRPPPARQAGGRAPLLAPAQGGEALSHTPSAALRWLWLARTGGHPRAGPCRSLPRWQQLARGCRSPPSGPSAAVAAAGPTRPDPAGAAPRPSRRLPGASRRRPARHVTRAPPRTPRGGARSSGGTVRPPLTPSLTLARRRRRGHVLSRALRPRPPSGARPGGWPAGGGGEAARAGTLRRPHTCGRREGAGRAAPGRLHPGTRAPHGGAGEGVGARGFSLCCSSRLSSRRRGGLLRKTFRGSLPQGLR